MRTYVPLLVALTAGCGQQGAVEDAIKEQLKDPGSAKFRTVLISKREDRACAIWNAKNSMGGYGEWTVTELEKGYSGWTVTAMEGRGDRCTEAAFKTWDRYEEASEATRKLLDKKAGSAPSEPTEEDKQLQEMVKGLEAKK